MQREKLVSCVLSSREAIARPEHHLIKALTIEKGMNLATLYGWCTAGRKVDDGTS